MQIINIQYQNEKGELIETLPINFADVLVVLYREHELNIEKYKWTMTIDPYGDTVFNLLQWPHLISEFEDLEKEIGDEEAKNILLGLIAFLKKNQDKTHTYLKFIGD